MSEVNGIINSVLDVKAIEKEVSEVKASVAALGKELAATGTAFKSSFGEAINVLKEIKAAGSFT